MSKQEPRNAILLSAYPLSISHLNRFFDEENESPKACTVSALRADGFLGLLKWMWGLWGKTLIVVTPDEEVRALTPVLTVLASLTLARKIETMGFDGKRRAYSRWAGGLAALRVLAASLEGLVAVHLCWRELRRLRAIPRRNFVLGDGSSCLYLRIALSGGSPLGGAMSHTLGVVGGLVERDFKVSYATVEGAGAVPAKTKFISIPALVTHAVPGECNLYRHHRRVVSGCLRSSGSRDHSFVYQRLVLGNYPGVPLSRRLGIPLVLEYNGSEVWIARNWGHGLRFPRIAMLVEDVCLRHAHLVIAVSEPLRAELIERGVETNRIVIHPNGVDPSVFDPERTRPEKITEINRRHGIGKDDVVVTFLGTFGPWHGAEVLAGAIRKMLDADERRAADNKIRFLFIGDGDRRTDVEALLGDGSKNAPWTLTGRVPHEEVADYLAASDIFVSPHVRNPDGSPFFGSPTKIFEYLSMGRPIVASDLDQIGEIFAACPRVSTLPDPEIAPGRGQCGILVEPGNEDELVRAIRFLAENPKWRNAAGRRARELALARYTWGHHVRAIEEGLERLGVD